LGEFLSKILDTTGFPPRWQCGQWTSGHGWLHIVSDAAIFGAYTAIPITLVWFLRRRSDLPFPRVLLLFAAFILACGIGHLIEATIFWRPWYRLSGVVKGATATISWITVVALVKLMPSILELPSLALMSSRLEAEARAARESEERFRRISDEAPVLIWTADSSGLMTHFNRGWLEFRGRTLAEELGEGWCAGLPSGDDALLEVGRAMSEGRESFEVEGRLRRHDGVRRWLRVHGRARRSETGELLGYAGTAADVTDSRAERQLLSLAVEAAPSGMLMTDARGTIVLANSMLLETFGYREDELLGQPVERLIPERYRAEHPQNFAAFVARPERRSMGAGRDLSGLRRDGSEIPIEIGLTPVETDQGLRVLAAIVDITERKRMLDAQLQARERHTAELQRSNAELDRFAYAAAHDLREPLRSVRALADWIQEDSADALPPESAAHLEKLVGRVERMQNLLDSLLAYSRVGRKEGEPEVVECLEVIRDTLDLVAPPEGFEIEVACEVGPLTCRRVALEQVLRNLISNAIKHHDREQGRITVTAREAGREQVEFEVVDDGPGIAPHYQERIFDIFQTLRPRSEVEGSGMGLAIVKKSVEAKGGAVRVESDGRRGCRFRFSWPKVERENGRA